MNRLAKRLLALIAFLMFCEIGFRASGVADVPLYDANSDIGYIPRASQRGVFLHAIEWAFNSKSMGASEFVPTAAVDNLLLGDSIVFSGNQYRDDRLGPRLSAVLDEPVWPIAAGSWALRNELIYLKLHPEVVEGSDRLIFVLNSGDFGEASSWSCDEQNPRARPLFVSLYLLRKYTYWHSSCGTIPPSLKVAAGNWKAELAAILSGLRIREKKVLVVLYPNRFQSRDPKVLESELEIHGPELIAAGLDRSEIYSLARDSRWNPSYYNDDIHPTSDGIKVLANLIGAQLLRAGIAVR
jgi:hypothetical protein